MKASTKRTVHAVAVTAATMTELQLAITRDSRGTDRSQHLAFFTDFLLR